MREKLLTTREVSQLLQLPEKEILDMAHANLIPHFRVAGEYLRFKKEDIARVRETLKNKYSLPDNQGQQWEKIQDFFYFNGFYLICAGVIVFLLWFIFKDVIA